MNTMHFYVMYNWRQCQYTRGAITIEQGKTMKWFDCFIEISLRLMRWCHCFKCCCWCGCCCCCCICKHWKKRENKNKKMKNERVKEHKTKINAQQKAAKGNSFDSYFFYRNGVVMLFNKTTLDTFKWFIFVWTSTLCQLHKSPAKLLPCNQSASHPLVYMCMCFYHNPIYMGECRWENCSWARARVCVSVCTGSIELPNKLSDI